MTCVLLHEGTVTVHAVVSAVRAILSSVYQDLYNMSWKASDEAKEAERKAQQEISVAKRKAEVRG